MGNVCCTTITGMGTWCTRVGVVPAGNGQTPSILPGWASIRRETDSVRFPPLYEQVLFLLVVVFLGLLLGSIEEHSRDAGSQSGDERQNESS